MKIDIRKGYSERRRLSYPSIADQLDAFWKGGDDAEDMRRKIIAIKSSIPKD